MLLSISHKFIFIHLPKTAGGSIRALLKPYCMKGGESRDGNNAHVLAVNIRNKMGIDKYNTFFKFAIVRNPWDRFVSLYHYILNQPTHFQHEEVKSLGNFSDFLRYELTRNKRKQIDFIIDGDGKFIIDFLGRFETLACDIEYIADFLQIPLTLLPHRNKSMHEDYREYYNEKDKELVAEICSNDIRLLGYTFDSFKIDFPASHLTGNYKR